VTPCPSLSLCFAVEVDGRLVRLSGFWFAAHVTGRGHCERSSFDGVGVGVGVARSVCFFSFPFCFGAYFFEKVVERKGEAQIMPNQGGRGAWHFAVRFP
jgi:hypothetical protein